MLSLTILNSVAFGLYGWCKNAVRSVSHGNVVVDRFQYFIAGCGVGLASSFLSTPFEVVKVKMQHSSGSLYTGSTDAAIQLVRAHGASVLFTGHIVNTVREMVFCTAYFGGYESLKLYLADQIEKSTGKPNVQLAILFAGGFAGMLGWLSSYPLDVLKNLKQTQPLHGTWWRRGEFSWTLARRRFAEHGWSGFYKGIRPSIIRAFFVSSTRFSAYEFAIRMWQVFYEKQAQLASQTSSASTHGPQEAKDS